METEDAITPENRKLVVLARSALARGGGTAAAAVRDETGRTHVAAAVDLPSLPVPALRAALIVALASGARGIEAGAVVGDEAGPDVSGAPGAVDGLDEAWSQVALPGCVVVSCDRSGRVSRICRIADHPPMAAS